MTYEERYEFKRRQGICVYGGCSKPAALPLCMCKGHAVYMREARRVTQNSKKRLKTLSYQV